MRNSRAKRALLGTIAAAFSTFVALLSHVAGGGALPNAWGVVTPLVLSTVLCVFLSGQRLSIWRLAASVSLSQFAFHALFVLGTTSATAVQLDAHAGHGAHAPSILNAHGMVGAPAAGMAHLDGGMWLAHAAAAFVTMAMLHRGERVLTALAQLSNRLVITLRAGFSAIRRASLAFMPRAPHPPARMAWAAAFVKALLPTGYFPSTALRRGPPSGACSPA